MISSLRGRVAAFRENELVLEVGGVGFSVNVPASVLGSAVAEGGEQFLYTYLVVREDALQLYGFLTEADRNLFLLLLGVNGVGPRIGLAALSSLEAEMIRGAIASNQPEVLARVPGIGRKTAERIIFQLRDKIDAVMEGDADTGYDDSEAVAALRALGYSLVEAQVAVQAVPDDPELSVEEKIRSALQALASGRL